MAIEKKTFVDGTTVINAQELNDWQDELIRLDEEKMDNEEGKGPSTNDYTDEDKAKLAGIAAGAQVNPGAATQSAAGLMSATDKAKLDGIAAGAQVNPGNATQSAAGLMSATDKTKLDGLAADLGITGASANDLVAISSVSSGKPTAFKKLAANTYEVLVVEFSSFSSLPQTKSVTGVESDMVCLHAELGTPAAQMSDWTVTTASGSVTVSGTITGSTTLKLYLMKSR